MKIKSLINWSKQKLFSSVFNSLITLFCIYLNIISLPPFIDWAFLSATFDGKLKTDCKTRTEERRVRKERKEILFRPVY